jgi:hypothetical protein
VSQKERHVNPVLGEIAWQSCHCGYKYKDMVIQVGSWMQDWLLSYVKKIVFVKFKELKTGCNPAVFEGWL